MHSSRFATGSMRSRLPVQQPLFRLADPSRTKRSSPQPTSTGSQWCSRADGILDTEANYQPPTPNFQAWDLGVGIGELTSVQQVLVYADSLTWGIVPDTRQRWPFAARWPGVMEHALVTAGHDLRVIEDC